MALQYSCLENAMDGGAWLAAVHGVTKSWTRLSDFTFSFHFHALEKEMATHSSVLAWRIPRTVEPGGLPSLGSYRVGHDWSNLAVAAAEVSETILSSFHSFYFILLFRSYFCHFIFQLTDSFFCFRYSAINSFQSIFNFSSIVCLCIQLVPCCCCCCCCCCC